MGGQKPSGDYRRPTARLGGRRHWGFRSHNRAHTKHCRSTRHTLQLIQKHKLQYAQNHINKLQKFYDTVLWSNETKLKHFGLMNQWYVCRRYKEAYAQKYTLSTDKNWGGFLMLCSCFASSGKGNLKCVEGEMDSVKYQDIQGKNVMPSVRRLTLGHHWTFQQDNDPKHTSTSTKAWFQKKSGKILECPSHSHHLNPIKNLYWDLKKAVAAWNT